MPTACCAESQALRPGSSQQAIRRVRICRRARSNTVLPEKLKIIFAL
ncbi:MAG: hypothetical protein AW07_00918 [Candidatus Accumulibacter sp. SK-11]|nr:MAG: hypothetical protein AW07_00918 [Candidatus Accumulibacter sp. SK-11]